MPDNIVQLPGIANALPPGHVDEDVVALLRRVLAEAERGEVSSVALATIEPGGYVGTAWKGSASPLHIAGVVGFLEHQILSAADQWPVVERPEIEA